MHIYGGSNASDMLCRRLPDHVSETMSMFMTMYFVFSRCLLFESPVKIN